MSAPKTESALAEHHVEQLRAKLLELSNRNRLLNFQHTPRARTHVRIIDELPEFLFSTVCGGQELAFQSLGPEPPPQSAPPGEPRASQSPEQAAKRQGLDPNYDLPEPAPGAQEARHADRYVQTLLFDKAMEGKLNGIRQEWQTGLNERGVDTLFAAFGFLEWYESDSSDKAMYAPLLLHPLEMERKLNAGRYEFTIRSTGGETEINLTLAARLRRDFGLVLPEMTGETPLAEYLASVRLLVAGFRRWRIRRFVTVGIYGFARLVMYRDLDPATWPESSQPASHPLIHQLLSERTHQELTTADDYPMDDPPHCDEAPSLVAEADSSQISAIVDVLKGKNLALKGPPGTGKSQTITNLIAAALHQGKSVLFVAEKMAALEVVQKRLADAGLGDFCLELHSTRAKKTQVLDRLRTRMERQHSVQAPREIKQHRARLIELRDMLNRYVRAWNSTIGLTGLTVHDAVWREQTHRTRTQDIAGQLGDIRHERAASLDGSALAQLQARASRLVDATLRCEQGHQQQGEPLWSFASSETLSTLDVPTIVQSTDRLRTLLRECVQALAAVDPQAPAQLSAPQCSAIANGLLSMPHQGGEQPLLASLANGGVRAGVEALRAHLEVRTTRLQTLAAVSNDPLRLLGANVELRAAARAVIVEYAHETVGSLGQCLSKQEQALHQLGLGAELVTQLLGRLGVAIEPSQRALRPVASALDLLRAVDRRVLLARSPAAMDEQGAAVLQAARDEQRALKQLETGLSTALNMKASHEADTLRLYAVKLRTAKWFSWLSSAFRIARTTYILMARGHKAPWAIMADKLDAVAEWKERRALLAEDTRLKRVAGQHFRGADTDLDLLSETNRWATQVRSQLAGSEPLVVRLRQALLSDSVDVLDELSALLNEDGWKSVERWLAAGSTSQQATITEHVEALRVKVASLRAATSVLDTLPIRRDLEVGQLGSLADAADAARDSEHAIEQASSLAPHLGQMWAGCGTDPARITAVLALYRHLDEHIPLQSLRERLLIENTAPQMLEHLRGLAGPLHQCVSKVAQHREHCLALGLDFSRLDRRLSLQATLPQVVGALDACLADREALTQWLTLVGARRVARESGLLIVVERLESAGISLSRTSETWEWTYHRSLIAQAFEKEPILTQYAGLELDDARRQFRELDAKLLDLERHEIASELYRQQPPSGIGTGRRSDWTDRALIDNELSKKTRHLPIRQLVGRAGSALKSLTPCFMMSPISVAQYLPPGSIEFDLVVVDEASQMRTEDALGALARGTQLVVVGDPKQLPPTAFFQRMEAELDDDDDEVDEPPSAESVLDLALSAFQPARDLRWHYRSRHESLIAFSNQEFYENRLQIFPSPEPRSGTLGVELRRVQGTFRASINDIEARAVAQAAVDFMGQYSDRSLGVVAMNQKQSLLIEEYVDELARTHPHAEAYRTKWSGGLEPFFVKNLENVQGDERDAILIGMTYGPDPQTGRMFQRFGPINGPTGHRRLNVLFTRAKERVIVVSSMDAGHVTVADNSSLGLRALRNYLQYAGQGLLPADHSANRPTESPFEEQVVAALVARGYHPVPQVGVRGFFIDIGVQHPSYPHGYLCGIECDGATYHSSRTARDRDRLREDILTRLGWRLVRIWSTDWFANPEGETKKLIQRLEEMRGALAPRALQVVG